MNIKERRKMQLDRHYAALVRLAEECGVKKADGKKLSVALLKIEREAHKAAEAYCNGEYFEVIGNDGIATGFNFNSDENAWARLSQMIYRRVQSIFNNNLRSLHINGDPRGYALKLNNDTDAERSLIEETGLQRDWGGYGLLAPEITGN